MKTKATSRIFKQTFAWILTLMMVFSIFPATQVNAATKPKLSKTKITMTVGHSKKLTVKGISKKQSKRIKWKSSSKKVVTVTKTGKIKARKAGKATITAKVGKKKLKCKVTVKKKSKKSTKKKESNSSSKAMSLSSTTLNAYRDEIKTLTVRNATKKVKWSSSNTKIVSVYSYKGTSKNKASVYANAKGIATVTAKVDGKTFRCTVKVDQPSAAAARKEKEALKLIKSGMSEQEKTFILTKWVCQNLKRADGYALYNTISTNCIVGGKAYGMGYALLLQDLLTKANVESVVCLTGGDNGARLKVKIANQWYNIHPYYMDQDKQINYSYFLISDKAFKTYHQNTYEGTVDLYKEGEFVSHTMKDTGKNSAALVGAKEPEGTSTRFDFAKATYDKAITEDNSDFLTPTIEDCGKGFFNQYNPWVIGTWRNY